MCDGVCKRFNDFNDKVYEGARHIQRNPEEEEAPLDSAPRGPLKLTSLQKTLVRFGYAFCGAGIMVGGAGLIVMASVSPDNKIVQGLADTLAKGGMVFFGLGALDITTLLSLAYLCRKDTTEDHAMGPVTH